MHLPRSRPKHQVSGQLVGDGVVMVSVQECLLSKLSLNAPLRSDNSIGSGDAQVFTFTAASLCLEVTRPFAL